MLFGAPKELPLPCSETQHDLIVCMWVVSHPYLPKPNLKLDDFDIVTSVSLFARSLMHLSFSSLARFR